MQIISRCRRHLVRDHSSSISVEVSFLLRGAHVVFKENKVGSVVANKGRAMENWLPQSKGGRGGGGGGGGRNHKLQSLWKDRQTVCNLHPSDNPRATRDGLWTALPSNSRQASSNTPAWILHEWFKRLSVRDWSRNWDPLQLINTFYR